MRGSIAALMALLLAWAASGCSTPANAQLGTVAPQQAAGGTFVSDPDVTPNIVSYGAEPRQVLAERPRVGSTQTVRVTQSGSNRFLFGEDDVTVAIPSVTIDATFTVVGVDPTSPIGERAVVDVRVDGASAGATSDEVVTQQAGALIRGLTGRTAQVAVVPGGTIQGAEPRFEIDPDTAPLALGWIERAPLSLADGLPTTPLGVGAEWTVTESAVDLGIPATSTRRYRITAITDTEVRASVTRTIRWSAGVHNDTEVLPGSAISGTGTASWPRNGVVGTVSFDSNGSLTYQLGDSQLQQTLQRSISSWSTFFPAPEPTTTTTTEAAPAEPDVVSTTSTTEVDGAVVADPDPGADPEPDAEPADAATPDTTAAPTSTTEPPASTTETTTPENP